MNITQQDFEKYITVAGYATTEIYDKIKNYIEAAYLDCHVNILGSAAGKVIEDNSNPSLTEKVKQYVCLDSFVSHMHELDLILTPTGFGVVSSEAIAPASKARIDALEKSMQLQLIRTRGCLLRMLRDVDGWGESEQAVMQIRSTFFSINQLDIRLGHPATLEEWSRLNMSVVAMDIVLRKMINSKQMDEILKYVRNPSGSAESSAMEDIVCLINSLIFMDAWNSPFVADKKDAIIQYMEDNPKYFSIYMSSTNYKANHYTGHKNSRDDKAFVAKG